MVKYLPQFKYVWYLYFRYTTVIRVSEQQPYQVKEYTWCFNVPPRCSKYKIKFKQVLKTQTLVKQRPVEECCEGYTPDSEGKQCVPVCVQSCVHGKCVAPNTCACAHGYGGPACDICECFLMNFVSFHTAIVIPVNGNRVSLK